MNPAQVEHFPPLKCHFCPVEYRFSSTELDTIVVNIVAVRWDNFRCADLDVRVRHLLLTSKKATNCSVGWLMQRKHHVSTYSEQQLLPFVESRGMPRRDRSCSRNQPCDKMSGYGVLLFTVVKR